MIASLTSTSSRIDLRARRGRDVSEHPYGRESENVWETLISQARAFYAWHTQATWISTAKLSGRGNVSESVVAENGRACLRREACLEEACRLFAARLCLVAVG